MALEEEQAEVLQELRLAAECLSDCGHFAGVEPVALRRLAAGAVHFSLPAGQALFGQGDPADAVYLLISGRLSVTGAGRVTAEIDGGELVGELGWLLGEARSATVVARRDSELLRLPAELIDELVRESTALNLALARLCARRLQRSNLTREPRRRASVFALVPSDDDLDVAEVAASLLAELSRFGRAELVWDARARAHTAGWFNRMERANDYVLYVADSHDSGWTRQCCRQADALLLAGGAHADPRPFVGIAATAARARGVRVELAIVHEGRLRVGAAARWRAAWPHAQAHHLVDSADYGRMARLLAQRGVGLVLSGGGARGFAHLGVIRALREARVPLDFVGGSSIGAIIAAGVAMGWDDAQMRSRYHRSFVATNPLSDYTFPLVALTRGRKVARLLNREFGAVAIEDLRIPFLCVSANLTTGRALEHREGGLAEALRASVAIPGILPPVFRGEDVLVDGAVINNLPVDLMRAHRPGFVIGCDVSAERNPIAASAPRGDPPFWRLFARAGGERRIHIFQVLMHAGMVSGASNDAAHRELADLLIKPSLPHVDLLNWQAFDHAIEAGYRWACRLLEEERPMLPRLEASVSSGRPGNSLVQEIARRAAVTAPADRRARRSRPVPRD